MHFKKWWMPNFNKKSEKTNLMNLFNSKEFKKFELEIPRDRNGEYNSKPKNKRDVSSTKDKIVSLYSRDLITRK